MAGASDKISETRVALNSFLAEVQCKALYQAELAVKNRDEALDIVQDAMMKLAQKYSDKQADWPRLFQRILQNAIRDWHRKKKVRSILVWWNQTAEANETLEDKIHQENDEGKGIGDSLDAPDVVIQQEQITEEIEKALKELPARQQQAFMLRALWGHDTEETAYAMNCSTGSVKTHYSRALQKLKVQLVGLEI